MPQETKDNEEITLRKTLASLDVQRNAMKDEADAIIAELMTPPEEGIQPMGLDTPLIDQDGYPRGDIDVYRARSQRNRFRVLKTDHKEIEGKIEVLLIQLASLKEPSTKKKAESDELARRLAPKPKPKFDAVTGKWVVMNWDGSVAGVKDGDSLNFQNLSENRETHYRSSQSSISSSSMNNNDDNQLSRRPFAKVDGVSKESPAEDAGMKVCDLVTRFGPLHAENNDRLRALAKLVPDVAGERGTIQIVVLRRSNNDSMDREQSEDGEDSNKDYEDESKWETLTLSLRPRPFSGRGMLGCHIIPYN
mmetsp:Transcript_26766/g.57692  ORF Transcript_26766/g.57692 Transcript_26766/m.57692 type:complete len:306 (+) Transcript_26766:307-1224(+)